MTLQQHLQRIIGNTAPHDYTQQQNLRWDSLATDDCVRVSGTFEGARRVERVAMSEIPDDAS